MRVYPNILNYLGALGDKVVREDGEPVYYAGNRAVVFKVRDGGEVKALKCYTLDDPEREAGYERLGRALEERPFDGFVKHEYRRNSIICANQDGNIDRFDCVVMEWVKGRSLTRAVSEAAYLNRREDLSRLAEGFVMLALRLLESGYVHGDVKPDNIMVREDGSMVFIDLDPVRVRGDEETGFEAGTPGYVHPEACRLTKNSRRDDYPIAVTAATLFAVADNASLWNTSKDRIIFSPEECFGGYCHAVAEQARTWSGQPHMLALLDAILSRRPAIYDITNVLERVMICRRGKAALGRQCVIERLFCDYVEGSPALVRVDDKWGYLTDKGVERFYSAAVPSNEGMTAVSDGNGVWVVSDTVTGATFEFKCDKIESFSEGMAAFERDGAWGYVDRKGRETVPPMYDYCGGFGGGVAITRRKDSYFAIDKKGTVVGESVGKPLVRDSDGTIRVFNEK